MPEYPFRFESSPKKKGTCPQCGQAHKFRYYEDLAGNRLEDFGRCDRTNACGYHLVPSGKAVPKAEGTYSPPPQPKQIYPAGPMLERLQAAMARTDSPFHAYCMSLGISPEHLASWRVGTEISRGNSLTVFVHEDAQKKLVNAKFVCYTAAGKRSKDVESFSLRQPANPLERYGMCLFGEHLLDPERRRPVMLVESEKSAVIASSFYPDYDWLATGSANGLTDAKIYPLTNREVYWLADADGNVEIKQARSGKIILSEGGRRNSSIRKLEAYGMRFAVIDLFPDRTDGYDIADAIGEGIRPDLASQITAVAITEHPVIDSSKADPVGNDSSTVASKKPKSTTKLVAKSQSTVRQTDDSVMRSAKSHAVGVLFDAVLGPTRTQVAPAKKAPKAATSRPIATNKLSNGIVIYDKDLYEILIKSGKNGFSRVADNFLLYVKYVTEDENEQLTWVLEIQPFDGDPVFVEVAHEDFNSASRLRRTISGKQYALKITDSELSELHAFLFARTSFSRARKILRYGYDPTSGVFFFANKAVQVCQPGPLLAPDDFNMIQIDQAGRKLHLSMPANNKRKADQYTLMDHQVSVDSFFRLYAQAYGYEDALIPFCFFLMALHRDLALRHKKFSPILYLKGGYGTGKSSMIKVLTAAFGRLQPGVNLKAKNTESALSKLMSQSSNTITWFDEYHNDITCEGLLQAAYDNDGYHLTKAGTTGTNETGSIDIYSALALTSNYIPANEIFFSRCVFIPIASQDKTAQQVAAFNQLEEWQEAGLGCLTVDLLAHRAFVEKEYAFAFDVLLKRLKKEFTGERIPERFFANMAQLLTVGLVLTSEGLINLTEFTDPADILDEFVRLGSRNIRRQYRIMAEKTALSEFIEIVQQLYDQHQIHEEIHFDFRHLGDTWTIRLWFPQLYNLYAQHYRRINQKAPADRDTLQQEIAAFEEQSDWDAVKKQIRFLNDGENNSTTKTVGRNNSCIMNYSKLQEKFGLSLESRKG